MTRPLSSPDPTDNLPPDPQVLQAEVLRLRETLRATLLEKERVLRLLRNTNTDLHGRVQGQTRQLSSLHRLITTINASLDLSEVAATALGGLHNLLSVEAAALALADSQGDIYYFMAHPPALLPALGRIRLRPRQGIVGRVIETGQAFVANEISPGDLDEADRATGLNFRSVLCQPVLARERLIGAVQLVNKWTGPFTDPDRAFVETVSGSLAVAIENARMYEEVQTQLKNLERTHAELVETQAQLVQSAKLASIGQLASGLAHEINNPIGIILGFAQLIGQRAADEKLKGYASAMEREAVRIRQIVSDLLGFARQAAAETTRVDLREVIERALQLLEYQLLKEQVEVVRDFAAEPVWVLADSNQLLQVLMNLIQNARQAMLNGGTITMRTWSGAREHFFSITDTGIGIAEDALERVFDPFFTTKPVGQGTGLGLSVSYGIVKRFGGDIQVSSTPGAGTTFTISLPKAPDEAAPA